MASASEIMVRFFRELTAPQKILAGGKGGTLAQLSQAGYPVPDGFVVLTTAFAGDELKPEAWQQVSTALTRLRGGHKDLALAVRSSANAEDSAQASFAGAFETVLDVRDDQSIRAAIASVRKSRHAARVAAYSQTQGQAAAHELAVVVQKLVKADYSGVLFTADPVSGSRTTLTGNYVRGLGEKLVAGEASGQAFTITHPRGTYVGPQELRRYARKLYRLGVRLEQDLGGPQDIEWALVEHRLALLQSRPITTLRAHNEQTGEWNDSLAADCLWTSACVGEAVPDVMTPSTWSLMQQLIAYTVPLGSLNGCPAIGNIGGRYYMNLSLLVSSSLAFGVSRTRYLEMLEPSFGRIPDDLPIPLIPFSRFRVLAELLPELVRGYFQARKDRQRLPDFLAASPQRCADLQAGIRTCGAPAELLALWQTTVAPHFQTCARMLKATDIPPYFIVVLRRQLVTLVGETDATALLSGLGDGARQLESLGPLLGLELLLRGEIDRPTYAQKYGHRSAHEFEISQPRPGEEPDWIDRQLAGLDKAPVKISTLLARQQEAHDQAWERLRTSYPRKAKRLRRQLAQMALEARNREATRSEAIRLFWGLRSFYQRAGVLSGQGDATFFLSLPELLAVLGGDDSAVARIPARRQLYERYCALPTYPALIRGRFDPFQWAADPRRRSDLFSAADTSPPSSGAITGFPGAAGIVEGRARVLRSVEEGEALQAGEILVAATTNVGWTLLFPRAAAVVTDVGAPLSHAAIVARELGIPAVVGCGNATMRLRTGDLLRVNGGQGTVEVLPSPPA